MQRGSSVSSWSSGIACAISPTSSASGSPTLTSSMSAVPACSATSSSSCERSPAWSWAWKPLRPVGLIRSPMTQNGCPGPMTTVLDRDLRTVSTRLPLAAWRDAEPPAEAVDAAVVAEADDMQACDSGQVERRGGELGAELEAGLGGVGGRLDPSDRLGRNRDPGHLPVHVAQAGRRADEADRRQQRRLGREAGRHRGAQERAQQLVVEADLELEEARTGAHLLEGSVDAVGVRRGARVLDSPDEEMRCRLELASGEVAAGRERGRGGDQLRAVEVEHATRLGLVACRDVVAGEAADVLEIGRASCRERE